MNKIVNAGTKCYRVSRSEIYVGKVVNKQDQEEHIYRSILFSINNDNLSQDLLYKSPNYPVINISDCADAAAIVVDHIYSLNSVLDYFHFNFLLYYPDVLTIKNLFFNKNFVINNLGLFGIEKEEVRNSSFYEEGMSVQDFVNKIRHMTNTKKKLGSKDPILDLVKEGYLPLEFIDVIYKACEISEIALQNKPKLKNIDAFTPLKIEGPIKRLK